MYNCTNCNYKTNRKNNWKRHIDSNKHQKKINDSKQQIKSVSNKHLKNEQKRSEQRSEQKSEQMSNDLHNIDDKKNIFKCEKCDAIFEHRTNLYRHINYRCVYKNKSNDENNTLKNELSRQKELTKLAEQDALIKNNTIQHLNETIGFLKDDMKYYKSLVNSAGGIVKTSVNALTYIMTKYADAPALEAINDYSTIQQENINVFIQTLIFYFNHNNLDIFLGDVIIKYYKKEDPSQQSLWNSDTSRLTYIIKELLSNKKSDWKVDKKGVRTNNYIVLPLLEHIKQIVNKYIIEQALVMKDIKRKRQINKINSNLAVASNIVTSINDGTLSANMMKHIAPYFYLDKKDDVEIDD
jgi:uncharacterized C2H2 Zn-finger protein